jgi:hypothetical protein
VTERAALRAAPLAPFDEYLDLRPRFAVTRDIAGRLLAWAEPLARQVLGAHARRDMLGLGDELPILPVVTSAEDNGGWGELMPVWFKPYERPVPLFILDNWALTALVWRAWLGDIGPAFNVENLAKILVGSSLLIPFMPPTQRGGSFLRHGALTVLLAVLWLPTPERAAFLSGMSAGAGCFAEAYRLSEQPDLAGFAGRVEGEAFLVAEGSKIAGEAKINEFLANTELFELYAALHGGLSFSVSALYRQYGDAWEDWVFQAVNVHYRYADFGLEAWARQLEANADSNRVGP